jgi:hypothetical protein
MNRARLIFLSFAALLFPCAASSAADSAAADTVPRYQVVSESSTVDKKVNLINTDTMARQSPPSDIRPVIPSDAFNSLSFSACPACNASLFNNDHSADFIIGGDYQMTGFDRFLYLGHNLVLFQMPAGAKGKVGAAAGTLLAPPVYWSQGFLSVMAGRIQEETDNYLGIRDAGTYWGGG